jgi:hypothetical protein
MIEEENPEEQPNEGGSFIELMGGKGNRGCSCSLGCGQLIILAILTAIAVYMIVTRFFM